MFMLCGTCNGEGYVTQKDLYNHVWEVKIICPNCNGTGRILIEQEQTVESNEEHK